MKAGFPGALSRRFQPIRGQKQGLLPDNFRRPKKIFPGQGKGLDPASNRLPGEGPPSKGGDKGRRKALGFPQNREGPFPKGEQIVQNGDELVPNTVPQKSVIRVRRIGSVGKVPVLQIPEYGGAILIQKGTKQTAPGSGDTSQTRGARPAEETHEDRFPEIALGMGREDPLRPDPPSFPVPCGMAIEPRRPLDPDTPLPGGLHHPSRNYGYQPEGYFQERAMFFYPPGISPAFLPGPDSMVYMETKKLKPQVPPQNRQGGQ
jgi:hypothetical protein